MVRPYANHPSDVALRSLHGVRASARSFRLLRWLPCGGNDMDDRHLAQVSVVCGVELVLTDEGLDVLDVGLAALRIARQRLGQHGAGDPEVLAAQLRALQP